MDKTAIEEKIIELCAKTYQKNIDEITRDTRFQEDLSPNSILRVGLSANIEEELDVMVSLAELSKFKTVGDMINFVAGS